MWNQIRPALVMIAAMTVMTGLVYPLTMTGIAEVDAPPVVPGDRSISDGSAA